MYKFWLQIQENFFNEHNRWYIWIPVIFGAGIGTYFLLPSEPPLWGTLAVIETLIIAAVLFRRSLSVLFILGILAVFTAGFANMQLQAVYQSKKLYPAPNGKEYLHGRILKKDYNAAGALRLTIENAKNFEGKPLGKVRVTLREHQEIREGQCVEMVAKLMPFFSPAIVGGYQFDRRAFFDGYSSGGYALTRALPQECSEPMRLRDNIGYGINALRSKIVGRIKQILPPDEAGIAAAVIAGKKGESSPKITQNYRDSGLAHFLSVSGLHMSMIAALGFFFIRLILALVPSFSLRYDSKKAAALFAIFISFVYLLISGMEIPAQRAFIMTFVVLLGILFSRRAISMYTIAWAAMAVLIISPQALTGPSFQMSFAAVVCLVAFYEKYAGALYKFLSGNGRPIGFVSKTLRVVWAYLAGIVISDFVASAATLPFAIYHFNKVALYTSLANLLAGPIIGIIIMPFILFSLCLMPLGLAEYPLRLAGLGISWINKITDCVSTLPMAAPSVLAMPLWGLLAITLGGLWLCIWTKPWRKWGWIFIALGMLSFCFVKKPLLMVNSRANLIAVQDNAGNMIPLPGCGEIFTRKIWLEKTASPPLDAEQKKLLKQIYKGKRRQPEWMDLICDESKCTYKTHFVYYKEGRLQVDGKDFDTRQALGAQFYKKGGKIKAETVREYIGHRLWN